MEILAGMIASALLASGVLVIAGLGETISQRAGVFNLGIEGFMGVGGLTAIATVAATDSLALACLATALLGICGGLFFSGVTVVLRINQVVAGLAFSFLGLGFSAWLGQSYSGKPAVAWFPKIEIPFLHDIWFFGTAFFNHQLPIYLAFIALPVILHYFLFRTRWGLNLRAVGEDPATADATGISVMKVRILAVCFGCMMASLAGAYLTLVFVPSWSEGITSGRGWIAIALVIFAGYRPLRVAGAAFVFGFITSIGFLAQANGWNVPSAFLSSLPYLATIIIMLLPVWTRYKTNRISTRPRALGVPYFREER